jgi:hypothetical protein
MKKEKKETKVEAKKSLYAISKLGRRGFKDSKALVMDDMIKTAGKKGVDVEKLLESGREKNSVRSHLNTLQRKGLIVKVDKLYFSTENAPKKEKTA